MNDRGVGGVVVVDEANSLLGIFTERDILRRVVAAGLPPEIDEGADVFTRDIVTCTPDTNVEESARSCRRAACGTFRSST